MGVLRSCRGGDGTNYVLKHNIQAYVCVTAVSGVEPRAPKREFWTFKQDTYFLQIHYQVSEAY